MRSKEQVITGLILFCIFLPGASGQTTTEEFNLPKEKKQMSAFIIFHSSIKDKDRFMTYAKSVPSTLEPYNGEVILKGMSARVFAGELPFKNVGIIRFPDIKRAHEWYESSQYQKLIENRNIAADLMITSYEEP